MIVCDQCHSEMRRTPPFRIEQRSPMVVAELCCLECVQAYVQTAVERRAR